MKPLVILIGTLFLAVVLLLLGLLTAAVPAWAQPTITRTGIVNVDCGEAVVAAADRVNDNAHRYAKAASTTAGQITTIVCRPDLPYGTGTIRQPSGRLVPFRSNEPPALLVGKLVGGAAF